MGRGFPHPYPLAVRLWGLWGSVLAAPAGSGAEPRLKMDFVRFELNRTRLWRAKTAWTATQLQLQFSVPNDLVFFSGQALKIRDCPEKFETDGHLSFASTDFQPISSQCGIHFVSQLLQGFQWCIWSLITEIRINHPSDEWELFQSICRGVNTQREQGGYVGLSPNWQHRQYIKMIKTVIQYTKKMRYSTKKTKEKYTSHFIISA